MDESKGRGFTGSAKLAVLSFLLPSLIIVAFTAIPARADRGFATFTMATPKVNFGESVTFSAKVQSDRPLDSVWVIYRMDGERAENSAKAEVSGGANMNAGYVLQLEPGSIPPGATIYYRWQARDTNGEYSDSAEAQFKYDDSRFRWQSVEGNNFTVYYYKDGKQASSVRDAAAAALQRIQTEIGVTLDKPVRIYIYASEKDMALVIQARSETYDASTVTLGMAMNNDTLVLLGAGADLLQTVAHELSHIVVGRATDNPFVEVPRWLDEGLAMYAEGELPAGNQNDLDASIKQDRVLTLRSMTSYPGDPDLVNLYYGQAYSVAKFMVETYGPDKMRSLLADIGKGNAVEESLQQVYGLSLDELENAWRVSVGLKAASGEPKPTVVLTAEPKTEATKTVKPTPTVVKKTPDKPQSSLPCAAALLPGAAVLFVALGRKRLAA